MKPLRSEDIQAFLMVVEQLSVTEAARQLGVSKSVVSKRLGDLEHDLGMQLLLRTTRSIVPTDAGTMFYEAALDSARRLEAAVEAISEKTIGLCGTLRVTAPVSLTRMWLCDTIADFATAHPNLQVQLDLDDRTVSSEDERYDIAISITRLPDSARTARHIATSRRALVCSPSYLKKQGTPESLDELTKHHCLNYSNVSAAETWSFRSTPPGTKSHTVQPKGVFASNNGEVLRDAAMRGLGIAVLPTFIVARELAERRLVRVLPEAHPEDDVIYAAFPRTRLAYPKVHALVEHLRLALFNAPWDALVTDEASNAQTSPAAEVAALPQV